jgi:hypothetical protein
MLGQSVARPNTAFPNRSGSLSRFIAGAREFATRQITSQDARALYGLRCAFAHEYGLRSAASSTHHLFALDRIGPLVKHPAILWVQIPDPNDATRMIWPNPTAANQTCVNVIEVGVFVEELVQNVRAKHRAGHVALAPGTDAMQLRNFSQFLIT